MFGFVVKIISNIDSDCGSELELTKKL